MEAKFNVTKEERKALVRAVVEITGQDSVYQGAPGFEFAVGGYTIDRNGTITSDVLVGAEDARRLLTGLAERGFVFEGDIDEVAPVVSEQAEPAPDGWAFHPPIPGGGDEDGIGGEEEPSGDEDSGEAAVSDTDNESGRLSIHMPLFGVTASAQDNVEKLVTSKAWILKKMADTDALPIEKDERHLSFPWFKPDATAVEVDAYSRLIVGICETAKKKKRVTSAERQLEEGDNEKFKARCFLLSIGFIGDQHKQARKVLLSPFSGNGSHKAGSGRKPAPEVAAAADSGEETPDAVHAHEDGSAADSADTGAATPLICGECPHHSYFSDGPLVSSVGEVVDTSNRALDKYTHYCLNTPSGFRKLKHATDWSGGETAPKWCPLLNGANGGEAVAV